MKNLHSLHDEIAALLSKKSLTTKTQLAFDLPVWEKTASLLNPQLIDPTAVVSYIVPFSAKYLEEAMEMSQKPGAYKIAMEFNIQEEVS